MIILYSRVIQKIQNLKKFRQRNSLNKIVLRYQNDLAPLNKCEINKNKSTKTVTVDDKKNEARTSKILLIIMASFVACWLPFFLVNINFFFINLLFY